MWVLIAVISVPLGYTFYMQAYNGLNQLSGYSSDVKAYLECSIYGIKIAYPFFINLLDITIPVFGPYFASALVQVIAWIACPVLMKFFWCRDCLPALRQDDRDFKTVNYLVCLGVIACQLVFPIYYPRLTGMLMCGTSIPNPYHNATGLVAKWINLVVFFEACKLLEHPEKKLDTKDLLIFAAMICFMVYAKPIFAPAFFPAMGLVMLWYLIRGSKQTRMNMVKLGLAFIPCCVLLLWQMTQTFGENTEGGNSIAFMPGAVWHYYADYIACSILAALIFPLCVLLLHPEKLLSDRRMQIGWLGCLIGLAQAYFLAETGDRFYHMNWFGGYEIAQYFLFAVSIPVLIQDYRQKKWKQCGIELAILLVHLAFGIWYFLRIVRGGYYV